MLVFFPVSPLQPKLPVSLVNVIDKAVKLLILLNLNSCMHVFLIFCPMKLEVSIKHLCIILKYNGCFWLSQGKHFEIGWDTTELAAFFHVTLFYFKEPLTNYCYSDVSIWQTFSWKQMKWICPFKKPLVVFIIVIIIFLPKIKLRLSGKNLNFGNLCLPPWTE